MTVLLGIDSGHLNTRAVAFVDGVVTGKACVPTDYDPARASEQALAQALDVAGVPFDEPRYVVATGFGRMGVAVADATVTEYVAAAAVASSVLPAVDAVIDVGAEGMRATKLGQDGSVIEFGVNDKCATGGGTFLQNMARVLDVRVEELSELARQHTQEIRMDTQCAVFAESEVVSLIHSQTSAANIAYAVQEALVGKVNSIALRVGVQGDVVMVGASSANESLVQSLAARMGANLVVADDVAFAIARGAALAAGGEA